MKSINTVARTAGFLYLILIPFSLLGVMYVPTLIVAGNAAATSNNIIASQTLFRLSIVSAFIVQIINVFVVLLLYKLLKPVSKNIAFLMVIFILLGVPIAMFNEINKLAAIQLLSGASYLTMFTTHQLQALMLLFLGMHKYGINIAGIFWGLWLLPMGYLVYKSGFLPRILGILLMIGCFGYLIDSIAYFLSPSLNIEVAQFTFIGEVLLPLWLLVKGVNVRQWKKSALESA